MVVPPYDEEDVFDDAITLPRVSKASGRAVIGVELHPVSSKDDASELDVDGIQGASSVVTKSSTTPKQAHSGDYRADVDGLRAVAVIAVIIYHMHKPWLPGGFIGVDIFFVISGFVVTGSLLQHQAADGFDLFVGFYSRRVKRLAPALVVVTLVSSVAISAVVPPAIGDLSNYYFSGQLALLGMVNNYYATIEISYWDQGFHTLEYNPFTHMWSLGVEEQFYFLFPFLVLLAYGRRVSRASPYKARWPFAPSYLLTLGCALSFVISTALSATQQRFAFYLLPSRFWQLILGAVLFEWQSTSSLCRADASRGLVGQLAVSAIEIVVIGCFLAAMVWTQIDAWFPIPWSLPAIAAGVLFIGLGSLPTQRWGGDYLPRGVPSPLLNAMIGCGPMAYVGRLSYPLYLWHWPVFVCWKWTPLGLESPVSRISALCLTTLLAMRTYHGLEPLFRAWKPRRRSLVFVALLVAVGVLEAFLQALRGPFYGSIYNSLRGLESSGAASGSISASLQPPSLHALPPPLLALSSLSRTPQLPPSPSTPPLTPPCPARPPSPRWPHGSPTAPPPMPSSPPSPAPLSPPPLAPPPLTNTCVCSNNAGASHTFHSPPDVDPTSSTPCFISGVTSFTNVGVAFPTRTDVHNRTFPCYFGNLGSFVTGSSSNPKTAADIRSCATPPPTAPGVPRGRVMFLVGDSHCGVLYHAVDRAVAGRMRVVPLCRSSTYFWPDARYEPWVTNVVEALQANVQPGDALAIQTLGGLNNMAFLEQTILQQVTRPRNASLVLLGDNPQITHPAPTCRAAPGLCSLSPKAGDRDLTTADVEQTLSNFASQHDDVFFYSQAALWQGPPGEHLWGQVPGTVPSQPAFYDTHHLLVTVAEAYLWPYLCSAFHGWGLFATVPAPLIG